MEKMKHIKEHLETLIYNQIEENEATCFKNLDTQELDCAIKMLKNISEAIYYCSQVKEEAIK
jgi:hypothetical protein